MVVPEFGEVQFMNDLMGELIGRYPDAIMGFPFYPTQWKEKWYGSDVIFLGSRENIPLSTVFLQFKRADKLIGSRAKRRRDFGGPYFRFKVHTENQHNTLVYLNDNLGDAGYVAPGFHKNDERFKYLSNNEILDNSLFISPERRADHDKHKICFTVSPVVARMYSIPEDIDQALRINSLIDGIRESGSRFETFNEQRTAFNEYRSTLIEEFEFIPQAEFPSEDEPDNTLEWITDQQRFFQTYFDIYPQFLLDGRERNEVLVFRKIR